MKLKFLTALLLLLAVAGQPARPQEAAKPLNKNRVMELVTAGMDSAELAKKVEQLGIDFDVTDDYLQALRKAGARDVLIQALRAARLKPLTQEQVLELVAGHVPSERDAALVKQRGIDFVPDQDYLETLRVAGAEDVLLAALRTAGEAARAHLGPIAGAKFNPKDGLKYVWIPPGSFQMGCSPGDSECSDDEKPPHQVSITKGYWLGQTAVTVGAYKRFAATTGRPMPEAPAFNSGWATDSMPIVNVDWNDAHDYCAWAGGRLPTEAEWEYAARAGSTESRYGPLDEVAWYDANSGRQTHPVRIKRANGFGLYDVLGNVWEWVNDRYDKEYYQNGPSQDPAGPTSGDERVLRGGSWCDNPGRVRVLTREWLVGDIGVNPFGGFRCGGEVFAP